MQRGEDNRDAATELRGERASVRGANGENRKEPILHGVCISLRETIGAARNRFPRVRWGSLVLRPDHGL